MKHVHLALFSLLLVQHLYDDVALFPPSLSFIYMLLYIQSIFLWRCWAFVCTSFSASSGHILLWQFSTFLVSLLFSVLALFSLPSSDVDSSVLPKCNRASYWIYIFNILDFFCDCPKRKDFSPFTVAPLNHVPLFRFPPLYSKLIDFFLSLTKSWRSLIGERAKFFC